jgi:T4 RnlA family RNA ligase
MLEIQSYLSNNSLEQLETELGIKHNRHSKYPNLVLLKYDQIKSPTYHPVVQECRGIILDEDDDWKVISYPFKRFYNYGQNEAEKVIDWSTAVVQEKLDGSLVQLFYYRSEWLIATSGKADAGGEVNGYDFTFEQLFWRVFNQLDYKLPTHFISNNNYTFIFELCSIYNKVVVEYKKPKLVLLGARRLSDYVEIAVMSLAGLASCLNYEIVKQYKLTNIQQILDYLSTTKGNQLEGLVVVDSNFNRIKIKSEEYVALHHIRSNTNTPYALLDVIRRNETEELLTYFNELEEEIVNLNNKYNKLVETINYTWITTKQITDRKEFALSVKDYFYSNCLFNLYLNRVSTVEQFLLDLDIKKLYQWTTQL